ncbi:DUF2158 domain-containing protein [Actibacterium sp. 188UL27-1]|uniref:DUF2158 domain-containing protein n=1 Tax=Actibacterium sp. 188UL27-1 TaxID=2786961 RepID=UPI00195969C6|nr:DUF2158 domain-containing protein [Actibacterium sp. 188UL27-1]MBM7067767.1 DUF2158 domain-containing protein [Actibacterium sp. 188UL27-1]
MNADKVALGDLVSLRSGGPSMTVVASDGASRKCCWFSSEGRFHTYDFPAAALKGAKDARLVVNVVENFDESAGT